MQDRDKDLPKHKNVDFPNSVELILLVDISTWHWIPSITVSPIFACIYVTHRNFVSWDEITNLFQNVCQAEYQNLTEGVLFTAHWYIQWK